MGNSIELGKLPPQAVDVEEAVLGELMIDSSAIDLVYSLLKPEIFYKEDNQLICKAIISLYKLNKEIDMLTVSEMLKTQNNLDRIGGVYVVSQLTSKVSSAAHIESHVKIVKDASIKRDVIRIANEIISKAYDSTVDSKDILDELQSKALNLGELGDSSTEILIYDVMLEVVQNMKLEKPETKYYRTHLKCINDSCNGFGGGTLTGIGARPSHGKSALAVDIAYNMALGGIPTAYFPLEMKARELASRRISSYTDISTIKLGSDNKKLSESDWKRIKEALDECNGVPLSIDDSKSMNVHTLKSKIRRLYRKGVNVFFIDYIQLMDMDPIYKGDKNKGYGEITRQLKLIAMELDIAIIILMQVNRECESRPKGQQMPMLSEIRDSGEIEQNLDNCIFIENFKMEQLKQLKVLLPGGGSEIKDVSSLAMADIAKARGGHTSQAFIKKSKNQMSWIDEDATFRNEKVPEFPSEKKYHSNLLINSFGDSVVNSEGKDDMPF